MKLQTTLMLVFFSLCVSCAPTQIMPPAYKYSEGAIRVHLKADPQLNLYDGRPHTLVICAYQLDSPNGYNNLTSSMEGLYKLLECKRFDDSVTNAERLIVHPGKDVTSTLNRAQGTKYVAVVAGYFEDLQSDFSKENLSHLFPIPVVTKSRGFFTREKYQQAENMYIDVELAPGRIKSGSASIYSTEK